MSDRMQGFAGFDAARARLTPIPEQFFQELLPAIDDLAELKLILYVMWAAASQPGRFRYVTDEQVRRDERFLAGLPRLGKSAGQALEDAFERAVARGTLLQVEDPEQDIAYYFVNSPLGREAVAAIRSGEWSPAEGREPSKLETHRPNIFRLYEQNIGMLTPLLAETLAEAQSTYPADWIEDAMRIAVANNVRNWRYVEAILEEWNAKGRDEREDRGDPEASRRKYTGGRYAEFIER